MSQFFHHNSRHRPRQHALELRVNSPRLFWLGMLRTCGRVSKWLALLAVLAAFCWGVGYGVKRLFLENDDFRLQVIELTPNSVIDAAGVAELGQIDLRASLFHIDTGELQRRLAARPDIVSARVERKLPDTLVVEVRERKPVAWLEWREHGLAGRDAAGMLLDADGYLFPCSGLLWSSAEALPVIGMAGASNDPLKPGERVIDPVVRRALRLVTVANEKLAGAQVEWRIERVRPANEWSLEVLTSDGEVAVFGLSEQARQIDDLLAIKRHLASQGGRIGTINLIPERNIPVVLGQPQADAAAPRAIVVPESAHAAGAAGQAPHVTQAGAPRSQPGAPRTNKLDRDVRAILNRN